MRRSEHTFLISHCGPAGLSKGPDDDFLVGCNTVFDTAGNPWNVTDPNTAAPIHVILNVSTGKIAEVPFAGAGDEVWFNSGDGNYYTASSGSPSQSLSRLSAQLPSPALSLTGDFGTAPHSVPVPSPLQT